MTYQQLEYLLLVAQAGSYAEAARHIGVTQPTLSMQLQKLEEEIGITLLDRSRRPVIATEAGSIFIKQAQTALAEYRKLAELTQLMRGETRGELKVGIIPTLAPYLVPLFVQDFTTRYKDVHLSISEITTGEIIKRLKYPENYQDALDCAILATPLESENLLEKPLFTEPFYVYMQKGHKLLKKKKIDMIDLDNNGAWVLDEGHCLRNQILNLCSGKIHRANPSLNYQTGSLETLKEMVNLYGGITILPYLSTLQLSETEKKRIRPFAGVQPAREISLVSHRHNVKERLLQALSGSVQKNLPKQHFDNQIIIPVTQK